MISTKECFQTVNDSFIYWYIDSGAIDHFIKIEIFLGNITILENPSLLIEIHRLPQVIKYLQNYGMAGHQIEVNEKYLVYKKK